MARRDGASRRMKLSTGAEMRVTGPVDEYAVVCVNGGQAREVEGTWSASIEWLVQTARAAPPRARLRGGALPREVVAAPRVVRRRRARGRGGGRRAARRPARVLDGRGGLRSRSRTNLSSRRSSASRRGSRISSTSARSDASGSPSSTGRSTAGCRGSPACPRRTRKKGFDRARERGAEGRYVLIPGALHGIALRSPWGKLVRLPKADRWAELVEEELRRVVSSRSEADGVETAGLPTAS